MTIDWNQEVESLGPALLRYFLAAGLSRPQASDAVQEVLIRLVQHTQDGSYDETRGTLRMYAFGIARFVKLEKRREGVGEELHGDPVEYAKDTTNEEADREEREEQSLLRRCIRSLGQPEQDILLLLIDRELKLEEIGKILKMPVGTVKSHVHRAKEKLRAAMRPQMGVQS